MVKKIVQKDTPVLRQVAEALEAKDFGSKKLIKILGEMAESLDKEDDGVAIAAPQIGYSLRIFLVSPKVKEIAKAPELPLVYINPKIIKTSKDRKNMEEGCLSVRGLYGNTKRATRVTIEAQDIDGNKFTWGGSGLVAQIFQHETDHLNGILFIDHATDIRELDIAVEK